MSIAATTENTLVVALTDGISNSSITGTALAAGDLVINGISVGAGSSADDGASTVGADASAIALAAAVNKVSDLSGVEAVVNANTVGGTTTANVAAAALAIT